MCQNCERKFTEGGFVNAVKAHQTYPKYPVITQAQQDNLSVFSTVNVKNCFGEGFWCSVVSIDGVNVKVKVCNNLVQTPTYNSGDTISIKRCHIRAILDEGGYEFLGNQMVAAIFH